MYKVIEDFKDRFDGGHHYKTGEDFPRDGVDPEESRVQSLLTKANLEGRPFIVKDEPGETAYPKLIKKGLYELSDGTEFKGAKAAAEEAEKALAGSDEDQEGEDKGEANEGESDKGEDKAGE